MSNHVYRLGWGISPLRQYLRQTLPSGSEGMVIEDIDLAIRRWGRNYDLDDHGDLMLIEQKEMNGQMSPGQQRMYHWINQYLRKAATPRWRGCHKIQIVYTQKTQKCKSCGQPDETEQAAFERFSSAKLWFNQLPITHEHLKAIVSGKGALPEGRVVSTESLLLESIVNQPLSVQEFIYRSLKQIFEPTHRKKKPRKHLPALPASAACGTDHGGTREATSH